MILHKRFLAQNDCYRAGRRIMPKGVMLHSTGANNPRLSRYVAPDDGRLGTPSSRHWNQPKVGACVHAFIGRLADGAVAAYQTLPWTMRGWHCGRSGNDTHLSIEICEDGLGDAAYFVAVYRQAVELTAYLCQLFQLDPLKGGVVVDHAEGCRRGIASNHGDVAHWFDRHGKTMDDFRADVARVLRGEVTDMSRDELKALVREVLTEIAAEEAAKPADAWAVPYIQDAIDNGLMAENGDGSIDRPQAPMTRQEAATTLSAMHTALEKMMSGRFLRVE